MATFDGGVIIGIIQGSAAIGIAHSQNQQGMRIVMEIFEVELANCKKQRHGTTLCRKLAEAMAINNLIESIGIEEYWNLLNNDVQYISAIESFTLQPLYNFKGQ